MYSFNYNRASSIDEATKTFAANEDAKFLAGGQTLIPTMKQRLAAPGALIDVSAIAEMRGIRLDKHKLLIGAAATHAEVATSGIVQKSIPALAALAGNIGDPHVRHRGTLGGSLANNDPAADYPAAVLALGATIVTNKHKLAAADFFTGLFETELAEDELIVGVRFPIPSSAAYRKFSNPASRYALAGVFVAKVDGVVTVAVTGAGNDGVFRFREAEKALSENFSVNVIEDLRPDPSALLSDLHASADYRAALVNAMTVAAVSDLMINQ